LSSVFGLAAQANEMHRFFKGACVAGTSVFATAAVVLVLVVSLILGTTAVLFPMVTIGTKPTFGHCGLGELVRAGVVKPVSQVSSEDRLKLLVMERLLLPLSRDAAPPCSSSEWLCRALVRRDS
jgi:hypothetical protein